MTRITVNDALSYFAPYQKYDSHQMPLNRNIKNGQMMLKGYWLYGNGSPNNSWDSRYFGEIPETALTIFAKPVLTLRAKKIL